MQLRSRNDDNQTVPDLLVHNTHDGEAVEKASLIYVRNMDTPDSPTEETFLSNLPHSTKKTHKSPKITAFPLKTSTLLMEDMDDISVLQEVPQQQSKRKLFTLGNFSYSNCLATKEKQRTKVSAPDKSSEEVFQELYDSFQKSRSEDKERTPKKPAKRIQQVRSKKEVPKHADSDDVVTFNRAKRRKKTTQSKPKISRRPPNIGVERLASLENPGKVNVLEHVILSTSKEITPIHVSKRLSIIQEASQEASSLPGVTPAVNKVKEVVGAANTSSKWDFENHAEKADWNTAELSFLKDLEVMKINLEYMVQMANMLKFETKFKDLLQSVLRKLEVPKK